ncbi:hypothetical protein LY90DRAFT_142012 [Neocallimastix californiae]|uniref:Ankyrin n=1 Tax=Neocallimastix californiae TaxID=1754190 RepID=A0A1Y2AHA1_9FUNG|nr:hypothetical protein LY90DRAFT_142012 [Neocallimastix californiae]|eukprot:ORY21355.1 hypothetical protein LY90DRAFT_142012 [Neocallimastix californiae]
MIIQQTIENDNIIEAKKILSTGKEDIQLLNDFKLFVENNKNLFSIDDLNTKDFDLLIYAINETRSFELIKYLIKSCKKYITCLNYETKQGEVPLFVAFVNAIPKKLKSEDSFFLIQYYIKIFNELRINGADINFCNRKGENLLIHLYNKELLNNDIFKILYNKK